MLRRRALTATFVVALATATLKPFPARANCSSPTAGAGTLNGTGSVLQLCDGTNWNTVMTSANDALVLISTQTASNSASLQWTSIPTYNQYTLDCNTLIPATNAAQTLIQFGEGVSPP